ncbi:MULTISPECIES: hypothetical protein [unclassified Lacrimispora]|uniref:hypothetical protein n=1 Tax=unclassified Lacrimispora TaxID=2719232 RepID=UPI00376F5779
MIILYLLGVLLIMLLICIYLLFKNENTWKKHNMVLEAIYKYNMNIISNEELYEEKLIDFDCIESYDKTFYRLYDWGLKRIVHKDVYEKIKNYL